MALNTLLMLIKIKRLIKKKKKKVNKLHLGGKIQFENIEKANDNIQWAIALMKKKKNRKKKHLLSSHPQNSESHPLTTVCSR